MNSAAHSTRHSNNTSPHHHNPANTAMTHNTSGLNSQPDAAPGSVQSSPHNTMEDDPNDVLQHLDDVPADVRKKWPKDLIAIIDMLIDRFQRMGYPQTEAHKLTLSAVQELSLYCGGRYFYLPKGDVLDRAIRDRNLYRDWAEHGIKPNELAAKYRLAVQHIYRIIKEQRLYRAQRG